MKFLKLAAIVAVSIGSLQHQVAVADEQEAEPSKLEKALAKFERTGEKRRCLTHSRIRYTRVVDDNNIIFEITPSSYYLNTLPRRCNSLGFHEAIKLTVRGGTVCARETFEVLDNSVTMGHLCSFGEFEKLTKKKVDKEVSE